MANKCVSCNNCGHVDWSRNKGNFLITLVLAFFFLVPAIIYEIWRRNGLGACGNCGSDLVLPSNQCNPSKKQIEASPINIIVGVVLFGGAVLGIVLACLFTYTVLTNYTETGKFIIKSQEALERDCFKGGQRQLKGQPKYENMQPLDKIDFIAAKCKGTKDGKFNP